MNAEFYQGEFGEKEDQEGKSHFYDPEGAPLS